ncbi:hypothetical protein CYMTET_13806 [Cymbomonas tetramitiformis]|uniref:Uncharacterized protein n=1 Tax=Cymbomonas tetramitiformis TaxID=36881 RepID=A0AAE0GIS5_9CHLO|nr:hypothetical protein CYMTET_13806 [Cymbomonas tetramitiformis]
MPGLELTVRWRTVTRDLYMCRSRLTRGGLTKPWPANGVPDLEFTVGWCTVDRDLCSRSNVHGRCWYECAARSTGSSPMCTTRAGMIVLHAPPAAVQYARSVLVRAVRYTHHRQQSKIMHGRCWHECAARSTGSSPMCTTGTGGLTRGGLTV